MQRNLGVYACSGGKWPAMGGQTVNMMRKSEPLRRRRCCWRSPSGRDIRAKARRCCNAPRGHRCEPDFSGRIPSNRVHPPVGRPGIRAQETDINNSDRRGREASSEGNHPFVHSTKRVENVTRTRQQGDHGSLVRWVLRQSLEAGDHRRTRSARYASSILAPCTAPRSRRCEELHDGVPCGVPRPQLLGRRGPDRRG